MYDQDLSTVHFCVKELSKEYQFHEEPLRLWSSLLSQFGTVGLASASDANERRAIHGRDAAIDVIASGEPHHFNAAAKNWVKGGVRSSSMMDLDEADADEMASRLPAALKELYLGAVEQPGREGAMPSPKILMRKGYPLKRSPLGPLLDASFMIQTDSYIGAVAMSLRSVARAPTDPLAYLVAAAASIGRLAQRQSDNRHQLILQAAVLIRASAEIKRKGKVGDAEEMAYEHFNLGRAFQSVSEYQLPLSAST